MLRNSAADTFYCGFTASKIWRLIQRAVIFPADFRRTNSLFGGEFGDRRRLRGLLKEPIRYEIHAILTCDQKPT